MAPLSARRKLEAIAQAVAPAFRLLRGDVFLSYEVPLVGRAWASSYYRPGVWLWGYVWDCALWEPPPEEGERQGLFGSRIIHLLEDGTLAHTHYRGRYLRTPEGDSWSVTGALEVLEEAPEVLELRGVAWLLAQQLHLRRGPASTLGAVLDLARLR